MEKSKGHLSGNLQKLFPIKSNLTKIVLSYKKFTEKSQVALLTDEKITIVLTSTKWYNAVA